MIKKMECGSISNGQIAKGCESCINGSKMVIFITGICEYKCYYCPISTERKGRDVTYANECKVTSYDDIVTEAKTMDATGTGITGGDPLVSIDRTVHVIQLLKNKLGNSHHIHLYTANLNIEKVLRLEAAGLDEIRFHPSIEVWMNMDKTQLESIISSTDMDVGIEVPSIPGMDTELNELVDYSTQVGVDFINLNELEFSESNWNIMESKGYIVENELSYAVKGSKETALNVIKKHRKSNIHFCSSTFKDDIQLRRRLIRRAKNICTSYQMITDDGTIIRGFLYADDTYKAAIELKALGVVDSMMRIMDGRIEVAPWIIYKIASSLKYRCYISEQYPTSDGLEVEKMPLN